MLCMLTLKAIKDSVSIGKNKINVNITMNYDETEGSDGYTAFNTDI